MFWPVPVIQIVFPSPGAGGIPNFLSRPTSVLPEPVKPGGSQVGVSNRMLDIPMSHIVLDRPGIEVAQKIDESETGQVAMRKQIEEAVRLLYVSFTRARDFLILPLQTKAKAGPWLNTLGAEWLTPQESELVLPDGQVVSCTREIFQEPQEVIPVQPDPQQLCFLLPKAYTPKLPAHIIVRQCSQWWHQPRLEDVSRQHHACR